MNHTTSAALMLERNIHQFRCLNDGVYAWRAVCRLKLIRNFQSLSEFVKSSAIPWHYHLTMCSLSAIIFILFDKQCLTNSSQKN